MGAFISLLLVNAANLITPQLLRALIDQGIIALDLRAIGLVTGGLIVVAVVRGLFSFLQGYWSEVASQGVAYDLRNVIYEHLQRLSFSYHDRAQTGKLMTRMTSDVEQVRMFVGQGIIQTVSALIMLVGTLVILFSMNWVLTLLILAVVPGILFSLLQFVRKVMPVALSVQRKLADLNAVLQENLAGMRVVKAFAREAHEESRYQRENQELFEENIHLIRLFTTYFPVVFFFGNLGTLAVIWAGGLQVMGQRLTLGELVAFVSYQGFLLMPIFMIGMIAGMYSRARASAERVFEVIDAQSEVLERPGAIPLRRVEGRVSFEDVHFRYPGGENDVLQGLSFSVRPGEKVAILGATGAGKSTIVNLIPRFYDVTSGRVLIDGFDVRDVTIDSLRSQIGIVLQETTLFSGTIRDNIAYGRPDAGDEEIRAAARAAQMHDFIQSLEAGYDSRIGERGVGLSGGQRQRLAIARAMLVDPRILLMDDSTSAVDSHTEHEIQQALVDLMGDRTTFIIAQRISSVRDADLILVIEDGTVAASGTHEELSHASERYVEILTTQLQPDPSQAPVELEGT